MRVYWVCPDCHCHVTREWAEFCPLCGSLLMPTDDEPDDDNEEMDE